MKVAAPHLASGSVGAEARPVSPVSWRWALARPLGLHTVITVGTARLFIGAPVNRAHICCRCSEGGAVLGDLSAYQEPRGPGEDKRFPVLQTYEPTLQIRADN